jgi:hypothetical protein
METEVLLEALERAAEAEENIALKMLLVFSKEKIKHLEHVIENANVNRRVSDAYKI